MSAAEKPFGSEQGVPWLVLRDPLPAVPLSGNIGAHRICPCPQTLRVSETIATVDWSAVKADESREGARSNPRPTRRPRSGGARTGAQLYPRKRSRMWRARVDRTRAGATENRLDLILECCRFFRQSERRRAHRRRSQLFPRLIRGSRRAAEIRVKAGASGTSIRKRVRAEIYQKFVVIEFMRLRPVLR